MRSLKTFELRKYPLKYTKFSKIETATVHMDSHLHLHNVIPFQKCAYNHEFICIKYKVLSVEFNAVFL